VTRASLELGAAPPLSCNGSPAFCNLRYDQVAYATTHNSFATTSGGWTILPAQTYSIRRQLDDGIRALMLDLHYPSAWTSWLPWGVYLCHSDCSASNYDRLGNQLREIGRFLDENPNEVVTLILENYVDPMDLLDELQSYGIFHYVHWQWRHRLREWPTLGDMIRANKRLVILDDHASDNAGDAWDIPMWSVASETNFDVNRRDELTCLPTGRGNMDNPLFLLNHFTSAPTQAMAANFNGADFIVQRARQCRVARGHMANFIAVNFHEIGEVAGAVIRINAEATFPPPSNRPPVIRKCEFGGLGGLQFDEGVRTINDRLVAVRVYSGNYIDGLTAVYERPDGQRYELAHGGQGGTPFTLELQPGETIVGVSGHAGNYVDGLQFLLSSGRPTPFFGGNGGGRFDCTFDDGYLFAGFIGRGDRYLDRLGLVGRLR